MTTCPELQYLRLTWAARAYKSPKRDEPAIFQEHMDNCDICWSDAVAEHSGYCEHGALACNECAMRKADIYNVLESEK